MSWKYPVMGLPAPEKEPQSVDEMRALMCKAAYDCPLIRRVMEMGRYAGMSGEDLYATLAYYALIELEKQARYNLEFLSLTPCPPFIAGSP
jgi:hypothetical protein